MAYADPENRKLQPQIDSLLAEFDSSCSTYNPKSIITRINNNDTSVRADKFFTGVFNLSRKVWENTNGAFDITIGPLTEAWGFGFKQRVKLDSSKVDSLKQLVGMDKVRIENGRVIKADPRMFIDVDADAQGYSVDVVAHFFESKGIRNYMGNPVAASPAYPNPVKVTQPDGTTVTVILKGDEFAKWAQTLDGYTLLYNSRGVYEYAVVNTDGDIVPSGVRASEQSHRTAAETALLTSTAKGLSFSRSQLDMIRSIQQIRDRENSLRTFPTTGARKLVCILMGFKDKAFTKTQADMNNLFNQVGYSANGATGSVKDFYNENSWNQFNLTVTVAGPFTAANNMSYYGGNDASGSDSNPRALVTEAVNAADATVNFADFDNDNDGTVDGVYVIYAGYGEEAGGGADCIWAHAWNITSVTKDGKTISKYSCSAELSGNSGSTICAIGVICHEFGHVLGAPDYYDTNYSTGGQFDGTGYWDIMSAGSWNNNGITPAHHNAYTKVKVYGWATATELTSATNVSVSNAEANKSFYQINSTTSGEYWLMENRQQVGFDANIPGHGLIIYHVNSGIASATTSNNINATYPQKMYPVCASATTNPGTTASTYGTINGGGCSFPGTSSKTSFTDATTPNMKGDGGGVA